MNNQQLNLRAADLYGLPKLTNTDLTARPFNPCENWTDSALLIEEITSAETFTILELSNYEAVITCSVTGKYEVTGKPMLAALTECYIAWKESE